MKIVCISDTHMWGMPLSDLPEGDILVHAGDGTFRGTIKEIKQFHKELVKHKEDSRYKKGYKEIIFVPGNHDWLFQTDPDVARMLMPNVEVLINETYHYYDEEHGEVLRIYGSPICPPFGHWAFYLEDRERAEHWKGIPGRDELDLLITHGPPYAILDEVPRWSGVGYENTGCQHLRREILERCNPKYHVFGHIHEGYGQHVYPTEHGSTRFINASIMDGRYKPLNKPIVINTKGSL